MESLVINHQGDLKIIDFGMARRMKGSIGFEITAVVVWYGTPEILYQPRRPNSLPRTTKNTTKLFKTVKFSYHMAFFVKF